MPSPIITAVPGTDPSLAEHLRAAGLPGDDLAEPGRCFFRFSKAPEETLAGFIGWEQSGPLALLRSLVVVPAQRGHGWSRIMTEWALARLAQQEVSAVYILTTTVAVLAQRFGFEPLPRDQAPPAIRASRQFSALCPASAVLLHRRLP